MVATIAMVIKAISSSQVAALDNSPVSITTLKKWSSSDIWIVVGYQEMTMKAWSAT